MALWTSRSPRIIFLFVFILQTAVLLFVIYEKTDTCDLKFLNRNACHILEERLSEALQDLAEIKSELIKLQPSAADSTTPKKPSPQPLIRTPPLPTPVPYDNIQFGKLVTIILYRDKKITKSCLEGKKQKLQQLIPNVNVLVPGNSEATVGVQFNSLIFDVKTKYFFFLNAKYDSVYPTSASHGVGWLIDALENIPELDFVSGSILEQDKLEIPCYRLTLCNWTLSQSYEYHRSIGEVMICDEIASSFIGRTTSVSTKRLNEKNLTFDGSLTSMSITDFFLQAKKAGLVSGVLPDVYMGASNDNTCSATLAEERREQYLNRLPFAHKHKVFRFRNIDMKELDLCDLHSSPIIGEDICDEKIAHKVMLDGSHWTSQGTFAYPFIVKNLQHCLFEVTDFLAWKNVFHTVVAGVALGAVKVRGVLPWDSGDIDMIVYGISKSELYELFRGYRKFSNYLVDELSDQIHVFCAPRNTAWKVGGIVTIFFEDTKPEVIQMKTNGKWVYYNKEVFKDLRKAYGRNYLEHKMMHASLHKYTERTHCRKEGHNACLPDSRLNSGTLKEHFCRL